MRKTKKMEESAMELTKKHLRNVEKDHDFFSVSDTGGIIDLDIQLIQDCCLNTSNIERFLKLFVFKAILSIWANISKVFTLLYRASLLKVFLALVSKIKWRFHPIIRHRNSALEFHYESIACTTICTLYVKINQLYLGLAHFPAAVT